jgi:hypothetical protein
MDILDAYIKFGIKLFHLTWRKKGKSKIGYRKVEEKDEFDYLRNEFLVFQRGYPNRALTQQTSLIMTIQERTWNFLRWKNYNIPHVKHKNITQSLINLGFYAKNEKRKCLMTTKD